MSDQNTIPKLAPSRDSLNYKTLIQKGRAYIEKIAGKIWTDYNVHDPGITTLELLCYAITDLTYRIELPIKDLLAKKDVKGGGLDRHFSSAKKILPTCPVSEQDYRKLFIDIEGVSNAWVTLTTRKLWINCEEQYGDNEDNYGVIHFDEPTGAKSRSFELRGFYTVLLELDKYITEQNQQDATILEARKRYHAYRNLCEDLAEIKVVPKQRIAFCSAIELETDADPVDTWAKVIFAIENYLHPSVNFYSLDQMLEQSDENGDELSVDEIFEGPVLNHGFIPEEELTNSELKKEVRASDIIRLVMEVDGVKKIDDMLIDFCGEENPEVGGEWVLCIKEGFLPVLCKEKTIINFNKKELPVSFDLTEAKQKLGEIRKEYQSANEAFMYEDLPIPEGTYVDVSDYSSIQNDFPNNYGINQVGLPPNATSERKALAKQLKGYLMVFDQMMATYMKHLSEVRVLFEADDNVKKSYFTKAISGVKDIETLFDDYSNLENDVASTVSNLDNYHERKNKFLDHLIARFAEKFGDFVFLMRDMVEDNVEDKMINYKVQFLRDYPAMSKSRFVACNLPFPETGNCGLFNLSGLQNRIIRLTGMLPIHEIYQELDDDGIDEYRWRIKDGSGKIILSASTRYYSKLDALEEMWETVFLAWNESNFQIKQAEDETYYFNIIKHDGEMLLSGEDTPPDEVVGRRIQYFDTVSEAEDAVAYVMEVLEEKQMYVFEHLQLIPENSGALSHQHFMPVCLDKNCDGCEPVDPYSFRITVVLPGFTDRFSNIDFRNFVEKTIRIECPAHILPKICWISKEQMIKLDAAYQHWLISKKDDQPTDTRNSALQSLLEILLDLHTVYPEGLLYDCKDPEEDENPMILNRTNLGNL